MNPLSFNQRGGLGGFNGCFQELDPQRGAHAFVSTDRGEMWSSRGKVLLPQPDWHEHMVVERRDESLWMLGHTQRDHGVGLEGPGPDVVGAGALEDQVRYYRNIRALRTLHIVRKTLCHSHRIIHIFGLVSFHHTHAHTFGLDKLHSSARPLQSSHRLILLPPTSSAVHPFKSFTSSTVFLFNHHTISFFSHQQGIFNHHTVSFFSHQQGIFNHHTVSFFSHQQGFNHHTVSFFSHQQAIFNHHTISFFSHQQAIFNHHAISFFSHQQAIFNHQKVCCYRNQFHYYRTTKLLSR